MAALAFLSTSFAQILGKAALNVERRSHTATPLSNGKVLIVGGENDNGMVGQAELFDPVTRTLSTVAASLVARTEHAAVRLADGRVLVIGGRGGSGLLNSTEIFDPQAGTRIRTSRRSSL